MEPGRVSLVEQINSKKALSFGRLLQVLAIAKGDVMMAHGAAVAIGDERVKRAVEAMCEVLMSGNGSPSIGEQIQKGAVLPGTTYDPTWAGPLAPLVPIYSEFVEYLRPMTIIGRLNARQVPMFIRFPRATAGTSADFVGSDAAIPAGRISLDTLSLGFARLAAILVETAELVKFGDPSAAAVVTDDAARAIALGADRALLDPTRTAVLGVSPASITNGATAISSTGSTADKILADLKSLMLAIDGNIPLSECTFILSQKLAVHLATLRTTTTNEPVFEDFSLKDGTLFGLPCLISAAVLDSNSPVHELAVLCHGPSIALADAGAEADVSQNAAVQLDDAPGSSPLQQNLVSLWQNNLLGIRVQRYINWERRRDGAVATIRGIVV